MPTFAVSSVFTSIGTMVGSPSGIKRRRAAGTIATPIAFSGTATMGFNTSVVSFVRNVIADFYASDTALEVNNDLVLILRSQFWWDKNWIYRRILQIQPNAEGFEMDHPLVATVSKQPMRQNKMRADAADLEILHLVNEVPETWEILPKKVEILEGFINVYWPNHIEIDPNTIVQDTYYIYYGNSDLVDTPVQVAYEPEEWPVSNTPESGKLSWTRPGEHWLDGVAQEDGSKVTLEFYGRNIRLLSDIGPEWGISEIQIDNEEWEQVDLYNPVILEDQEVYQRTDLSIATHIIRVRRSGFKAASATEYKINIKSIDYLRYNSVTNVSEEADETLMWGSVIGGVVGNK